MQPPTMGSFGPPSTSVAASFVDRGVPMTSMVSMVSDSFLIKWRFYSAVHTFFFLGGTSDHLLISPFILTSWQNGENRNLADVRPRAAEETVDKSRIWKPTEINEPSQCRSLKLPDSLTATRVWVVSYLNHEPSFSAEQLLYELWKLLFILVFTISGSYATQILAT